MNHAPIGKHCILEIHGCPSHLLDDESFIREALAEASRQGMSTLLNLTSHKFHPQGCTALALLAESHISIHTWPEAGYAAVDVFTCGETSQPEMACAYLVEQFKATGYQLKSLPRGAAAGIPMHHTHRHEEAEAVEAGLCEASV